MTTNTIKPGQMFASRTSFSYEISESKLLKFYAEEPDFVVEVKTASGGIQATILTEKEIIQLPWWTWSEWNLFFKPIL